MKGEEKTISSMTAGIKIKLCWMKNFRSTKIRKSIYSKKNYLIKKIYKENFNFI